MEMDIPDTEELEWLEAQALLPEELEEDYFAEEESHNPTADQQDLPETCPDRPQDFETRSCRKRIRTEESTDAETPQALPPEEEEAAKRRATEDVLDEDWIRYSPPKDTAPGVDVQVLDIVEEKMISRFASEIEGDCIPVTGPEGERVYAKLSPRGMGDGRRSNSAAEKPTNGLLSEPINVLSGRVEQEAFAKALQESFESQDHESCTINQTTEQLWVEKYAPKSFTELLSDENTNREVLMWLKQWDSHVFGSQIKSTTDGVLSALRQHSSVSYNQNFSNKNIFSKSKGAPIKGHNMKFSKIADGENNNLTGVKGFLGKKFLGDKPPEHKVLLLCGPPGLGKTTLAHVAAKHCGYRAVEINASDDRSSSSIESKILDVVQINSVMPDCKPKCLVIDEIDGALGDGKGAVEVILKMVAADKKSNVEKGNATEEVQPRKGSSRKGNKPAKLSRPVICICNDLYVPALRQLRQVAKVHTFVQPTITRVVNRLKYICNKEGFKTSTIALSALAEHTECDIRSCLNTLQFLHKKRVALNISEVDSQVIGQKDMSRSILDVWKEVFQKKRIKRGGKIVSGRSEQEDMNTVYSLISNRGEYELTMDGIHENLLRLSYHDPMMQKTVKCLDMLGISDSLLQYAFRTQRMSLHAHQPPIAIAVSRLIAQVEKANIEWPKNLQRCRALLTEKKNLMKTWQNQILPSISRHLSVESFVEDVTSPFLHIISPLYLRPVTLHLLSEREKDELAQLVDTMVSYSVTYKTGPEPPEKRNRVDASHELPALSLDPPIDDFVNFKDYQSEFSGLSLAMKQVLVHEVEKQKILHDSVGKSINLNKNGSSKSEELTTSNAKAVPAINLSTLTTIEESCNQKATLSQRQRITHTAPNSAFSTTVKASGASKKPSGRPLNFFDRFRKGSGTNAKTQQDMPHKAATTERDSRPLLFKYNEGFTNAVKRPVKIRDLLL